MSSRYMKASGYAFRGRPIRQGQWREFSALVDSLNILQFDGIIGTLKQAQVYFNAYGKSPSR
jgi:hypothetical protein